MILLRPFSPLFSPQIFAFLFNASKLFYEKNGNEIPILELFVDFFATPSFETKKAFAGRGREGDESEGEDHRRLDIYRLLPAWS
jgi:hypothetical protein